MTAPTVLHLFAGSGGCTLGFVRAGFRSLGSIDFDEAACRDLERLTGSRAFCRDLAAMEPAELRALTGSECPDVVVMSPPCKSFSGCMPAAKARSRRYVDMSQLATRGVFLALEAWAPARPRIVLLENVPRIQTRGAELLAQDVGLLQRSGYATDRELAVLQGFPADCLLEGPSSSSKIRVGRREHIGNAIPPPTAEAIAREVLATLAASADGAWRLASGDVWVSPEEAACPT